MLCTLAKMGSWVYFACICDDFVLNGNVFLLVK